MTGRGRPPSLCDTALPSGLRRREEGQVTLLLLGLSMVVLLLIVGTVAVTSAHLARMRLLDTADAAALDAADALDARAYGSGVEVAVPLSDTSVRDSVAAYLRSRPLPTGLEAWAIDPATGSPDGRTAVVALSGRAGLPMVGGLLDGLGGSVTIHVVSRARADVEPP